MSTGIKEERKKIQRAIEHLTQHGRKDLVLKELRSLQRYINATFIGHIPAEDDSEEK